MRRSLSTGLAALSLVFLAGCSLTGLSDFPINECSTHTDCDGLNARRGEVDPCVRYQCAADRLCRLQPLDLDRDGHADARCAGSEGCGGDLPCDDCDDDSAVSFPGQAEICDGFDNDCNLIVDDSASAQAGPTILVSDTGAINWHAYGAPLAGSGVVPVAIGATGATSFNVGERDEPPAQGLGVATANLTDLASTAILAGCPRDTFRIPEPTTPVGSVGAGTCVTHEDCSDGVLCNGFELCDRGHADADPATGCVTSSTEAACRSPEQCDERLGVCDLGALAVAGSCPMAQIATAELAPRTWFAAAVQQTGCGGLVRVGYFTETVGDDVPGDPGRRTLFRGTQHRSTSFRGVDPLTTESGNCTGRSRADGEPVGARLPAIAALHRPIEGRRRPQALAAWIATNVAGPGRVEVIGLWLEQFTAVGSPVFWVNATGNAVPQPLETAVGDSAPVLAAFAGASTAGYLVAYGVAGGGIAVRYVPAFDDPALVQTMEPYNTPIFPGATERRSTDPIADLGTATMLATSGEASQVELVIGRVTGDGAQLGLAWRDADGVRFSTIEFDAAGSSFSGFAPQLVAGDAADEVSLGYTPSAVVLPGFARGGAVADASSSGGWLVAWSASATVRGARFAELDGERVAPQVMRLGGDLRRLHIYVASAPGSERDLPRLAYQEPPKAEFSALGAFCGPPG